MSSFLIKYYFWTTSIQFFALKQVKRSTCHSLIILKFQKVNKKHSFSSVKLSYSFLSFSLLTLFSHSLFLLSSLTLSSYSLFSPSVNFNPLSTTPTPWTRTLTIMVAQAMTMSNLFFFCKIWKVLICFYTNECMMNVYFLQINQIFEEHNKCWIFQPFTLWWRH